MSQDVIIPETQIDQEDFEDERRKNLDIEANIRLLEKFLV